MIDPTLAATLRSWTWRADVLVLVGALAAVYLTGWIRLRRRGPAAAPAWGPAAYLGGLVAVVVALLSPVDALADWLFVAHMVQHELLVMVAAPLLLLANPLSAMLWALPARLRRTAGHWITPPAPSRRAWRILTWMPVAWLLHVAVLWGWHDPGAYDLALRNDLAHDAEHLSFFLTAVLFWWPVISPAPRLHGHVPYAFRLPYLVVAGAQNTLLAFLITTADAPLYPHYAGAPRLWGIAPLEDQGYGGIVMWVVGGMMYLAAVFVLLARMLERQEVEARALRRVFGRRPA